jgi:competence protein ComEC
MAGVFLLAFPLRREPNIHNSWALALIILLSVNPSNLFNLGFQLSFVSVLAILYLYPYLRKACRIEHCSWHFLRLAAEAALVSLAVWLATAGFIACSSRMFAPVTVVANLLLVPIAGVLTLCGFTVALSSCVWPAAAACFGAASQLLLLVMIKLNVLLLQIPYAYISW